MVAVACGCSGLPDTGIEQQKEMPVFRPDVAEMAGMEARNLTEDDTVGVYVTEMAANGNDGLLSGGNYADNLPYLYGAEGLSYTEPVYFPIDKGDLKVYAYYPYIKEVEDITAVPVRVAQDQRSEEDFRASDFLWARTTAVFGDREEVRLEFSHRMSRIVIELSADTTMNAEDAEVRILNLCRKATANLSTGSVTPLRDAVPEEITPRVMTSGGYEALIPPQHVNEMVKLIRVTTGGRSWSLVTPAGGYTFRAGETLTFKLTLTDI